MGAADNVKSGMRHTPDTKQRSEWRSVDPPPVHGLDVKMWERNVHDGTLRVMVGTEPHGLHLSISHTYARKVKPGDPKGRYPSWDEIMHARNHHLPPDVGFVMHLPPADEYVAMHQTTFHLHEAAGDYEVDTAVGRMKVWLLADPSTGAPKEHEGGLLAVLKRPGEEF